MIERASMLHSPMDTTYYLLLTMLKAKETFSFWVRVFLFKFTTSEINILFPFVITRTTLKGVFNQEFVSQVWQALSLFFF